LMASPFFVSAIATADTREPGRSCIGGFGRV
jgi:hypothetical protein